MTRDEWVLLPGLLGMLGLLNFASGVDSASLSGLTSANEIAEFRVCAGLCEAGLAGKSCEVFCTSRRQFTIQSNTVAGEKDVVVSVGETRLDACPTLCQHDLGFPICTCEMAEDSEFRVPGIAVPWEKICAIFCEDKRDKRRLDGCPECRNSENGDRSAENNEQTKNIDVYVKPARILRSLMEVNVTFIPRGVLATSDVTGERDGVNAEVDFPERQLNGGLQWTKKIKAKENSAESDWEKFCEIECARGNGGLACSCDVIP